MTNLVEVVFESVDEGCIIQFFLMLIQGSKKISGYQCSENIPMFTEGELSEEELSRFLDFNGDASILINADDVKLGDVFLPNIQLRLVKYGCEYDVDFNFNCDEIENVSMGALINGIHSYAKSLALEFGISSYYGGMEPASDEETRYFTNEEVGPLIA
ncbi:hypothetical protein [Nitrincola sp. MINF-07-Sa-05]|uniref:hypothetical protein n=1 Tax=Nitrincola salilacus TaxID=3400273 RepID=UPI00391829EC